MPIGIFYLKNFISACYIKEILEAVSKPPIRWFEPFENITASCMIKF